MFVFAKYAMRVGALLVLVAVSLVLHYLLPGHGVVMLLCTFFGLWCAAGFAFVLLVSSLFLRRAGQRIAIGQRMRDKVDAQVEDYYPGVRKCSVKDCLNCAMTNDTMCGAHVIERRKQGAQA